MVPTQRPLGSSRTLPRGAAVFLLLLLPVAACREGTTEPTLDLSGTWALTVDGVCQGPMTIVQTRSTFEVTGSVGGAFCPFNASGTGAGSLNGRELSFGIGFGTGTDQTGTGLGSVDFGGNVEPNGSRMSGSYVGTRSGTWAAVRN
jgi:hypothetical protein